MPKLPLPRTATIAVGADKKASRGIFRVHRFHRKLYHDQHRRKRRSELLKRISLRSGTPLAATKSVLDALGPELYAELCLYGDARLADVADFKLVPEVDSDLEFEQPGSEVETLHIATSGFLKRNHETFIL